MRGAGTGDVGIGAASGAAVGVTGTGSMAGTGKLLHTAGVKCDIQVGAWMGLALLNCLLNCQVWPHSL